MGLKLEVGKYYRDADGNKRGPMSQDPGFDGLIWDEGDEDRGNDYHWMKDGQAGAGARHAVDLIAEWPDAPTGPVRTVTRKEVVPGIYNRLGVGEQSGDCIWVGLVENDGDYDLGSLLNASQLRALAATLTEIADALEEE